MCGVVGFIGGASVVNRECALPTLRKMADSIVSRGPDSCGFWFDSGDQVALGHRRLAIVDLSPAGNQPMASPSGRYMTVFNGEIYNHQELREQLQASGSAPSWHGHSDTETMLACMDAWGLERAIGACVGMFAIAVWDRKARQLSLVRDRLGEKPLYYGWQGRGDSATFMFASELKALKGHAAFDAGINRGALALLLRHNCIPAPHSIYEGIRKLQPGQILNVSMQRREPRIETYWSMGDTVERGAADRFSGSPDDAVDELESLLSASINRQMVADVPLGAFLSGGIDSSAVVALMQAQASRPVKTFTIGFNEDGYNEAVHAKAVASHLGTEHTELYVPPKKALDVVPKLAGLYCEPFSDSSQIPTYLVSELARQHVTVALSGDAGDELFAGYGRYTWTYELWGRISRYPLSVRRAAAAAITSVSPGAWSSMLKPIRSALPSMLQTQSIGDRLHKGASVLANQTQDQLYRSLVSHWSEPEAVVIGAFEPKTKLAGDLFKGLSGIEKMMALDSITYLPDDILVKVDRAAMGVSLETRVPMLDHRIVEFAWRLPLTYKIRNSVSKWVLRQVLYRHVPKELIDRPKMGFGVPLDEWLRTSLRDWGEALLDESRLRQEGYFDPVPIRQKWVEHQSGKRNWQYQLWDILMFQSWLDVQNG